MTNAALLTAGTLDVELAPGSYAIGQQFTLVDAGTLDGLPAFDNPSLFFDLALAEVGERLVLTVTPTGSTFEAFARPSSR